METKTIFPSDGSFSKKTAQWLIAAGILALLSLSTAEAEDFISAAPVADAVDALRSATLEKIDSELTINAVAFADAKNIQNSLRWGDWFRPTMDITMAVYDGLTDIPVKKPDSVRSWIKTAINTASTGKGWFSIGSSLDRFKQDGETLALTIDGPAYNSTVVSMLNRADDATVFFNYSIYESSIRNDLLGYPRQSNPILVSHKSTVSDRRGGNVFGSVWDTRAYISSSLAALRNELQSEQMPRERVDALVAFLKERKSEILESRVGMKKAKYEAFLDQNGTPIKVPVSFSLGTIAQLENWRGHVLETFVQSAGLDSIEIKARLVEKVGDFVSTAVFDKGIESLNLNLNVEAVIAGQAEANVVLKDATSLGISLAAPDLGVLTESSQNLVTTSREQINLIPAQMLDAQSGELSKLLLITDDSARLVRLTATAPCILDVSPKQLSTLPLPQTQLMSIQGSNFTANSRIDFVFGNTIFSNRIPIFVSSTELQYNIAVGTGIGSWQVIVKEGDVTSLPYTFNVTSPNIHLVGLTVQGPSSIYEHQSTQLTAVATFDDGTSQTVNAVWTDDSSAASISTTGLLAADEVAGDTPVSVTASFSFGGVLKSAVTKITILNSASQGSGSYQTTQVLLDPSFENRRQEWAMTGPIIGTNPNYPYSGSYYAVFGEIDYCNDVASQETELPATTTQALLSCWVWVYSDDIKANAPDVFTVAVLDGNVLEVLGTLSNLDRSALTGRSAYREMRFDIAKYRGKRIKVLLSAVTDGSGFTSFKVDDVTLTVTSQLTCAYQFSRDGDSWAPAGGADSVTIMGQSGCSYNATTSQPWLRITSGGSGIGTGFIKYFVDANPSTQSRTATINVGDKSFTVAQGGNPSACTYRLSAAGYTFAADGGSDGVTVFADPICETTATVTAPWIQLTATGTFYGTRSIGYKVLTNETSLTRTGFIQVGNQSFSVIQQGAPLPPGVLSSGLWNPARLLIEKDGPYAYISEYGGKVVRRVAKDGSSEIVLANTPYSAAGLALDNETIYIADSYNLYKMPKAGGTLTTVLSGRSVSYVSVWNGRIYWDEMYPGNLFSSDLNGGDIRTEASNTFSAAALLIKSNVIYWSTFDSQGAVNKKDVNATNVVQISNWRNTTLGLAVEGPYVYWTGGDAIYKAPINGGDPEMIVNGLRNAYDLATDGSVLVWVENRSSGWVKQMALGGGPIVTLATNVIEGVAIGIDNEKVYWLERNGGKAGTGSLRWVAKAQTLPDLVPPKAYILTPQSGAKVDNAWAYFSGSALDDVALSRVELKRNEGAWYPVAIGQTNWATSMFLNPGTNHIYLRSRDMAGNYSEVVDTIVVFQERDTQTPILTVAGPTNLITSDATIGLSGTAEDNVITKDVSWIVDRGGAGLAILNGTNWTIPALPVQVGRNSVVLTCRDDSGNQTNLPLTVIRTSPDENRIHLSTSADNGATIRFAGEPGVSYVIESSTDLVHWLPFATNVVEVTGEVSIGVSLPKAQSFFRARRTEF